MNNQKGYTLIELLVALAISGAIITVVVAGIMQTTRITTQASVQITALRDISNAVRPLLNDVRMVQTTEPDTGAGPATSLIMDWTVWYDAEGDLSPVDYHCEYALSGTELERKYWSDYNPSSPGIPDETTTSGRYISSVEFSRHEVTGGGSYIKITLTSSPEGREDTERQLTYQLGLKEMEPIPEDA